MKPTFNVDDHPQLELLECSYVRRDITKKKAVALYERNWRFVDVNALTTVERALIDRSTG